MRAGRIFQDLGLVDIVDAVLAGHGVARRWNLASTPKKRAYAVQYKESDYDFVARLLAEEGIFFHFESPLEDAAERLVLCDDAERCPPIDDPAPGALAAAGAFVRLPAPPLPYRPYEPGQPGGEHVHRFELGRSIRAQSVEVRDYDFERPLLHPSAGAAAEPFHAVAGLEIYEHHGEYGESDVDEPNARVRLEQHRARAAVARGESSCRRLAPASRFLLAGHPSAAVDQREYAVVSVTHEGHNPEFAPDRAAADTYRARFDCVPAEVAYRPKRPSRQLRQVVESAVVVGPSGEDIHTDKHGRVKVQFHWDREGRQNERSSCWIRVLQALAGVSWGTQFVPRVGMEVLVSFIGGDPDRPVVIGALYNATHPTPFPLPQDQAKSGIRTQSIGGAGYSELSFVDSPGAELVYLKAERDHAQHVGGDLEQQVGGDHAANVAGSRRENVARERHVTVGGSDTHEVAGSRHASYAGDHTLTIGGQRLVSVAGEDTQRVSGASLLNLGNETATVTGYAVKTVGSHDAPTALSVVVHGSELHDASKSLVLRSAERLVLECGEASVALTPETIRLDAKRIVIRAKEKLLLLGDGPAIELGKEADVLADTIKLFSKGGSVELDADAAHVDGPLVKLNCGAGEAPEVDDELDKPKTMRFHWRCLDANLEPLKNKTYRLAASGFRAKGTTDGDGFIDQELPRDAMMANLTLWTESFPEGERLHYTIRLGDLPPASSVQGAQLRLRNLGYYFGPEGDEATPELAAALVEFQHDHGLPLSGALDDATAAKLGDVHPS